MTISNCELIGVRVVSPIFEQKPKPKATLAEIKRVIQPMLSKWAAMTDLAIQRERWDNGGYDKTFWPRPKRGAKNWVSLRSDKRRHTFEIATECVDEAGPHNIALKKYALLLEHFIEQQFDQKVPVEIGTIPTYTVTSGKSSATEFRDGELADDPDEIGSESWPKLDECASMRQMAVPAAAYPCTNDYSKKNPPQPFPWRGGPKPKK